jgi:hypothetical protein
MVDRQIWITERRDCFEVTPSDATEYAYRSEDKSDAALGRAVRAVIDFDAAEYKSWNPRYKAGWIN